jgi:hypothetical protein
LAAILNLENWEMEQIIYFLKNNYEWIFSGVGIFGLSLFLKKKFKGQKQKIGDNSVGIQAGKNINIKEFKNRKNV